MELCEQCESMLLDFEIEKYNGLCVDCYEEREIDEPEEQNVRQDKRI